ncbi:hypothetical protein ACFVAV_33550 [Nocardia sp. NPDC057663]|uniref:hypothetical protein n=1 Tax=Nocardia sp. NPDC057663 TaxID=3346201 RepID=UPI003671587C
MPDDPRSSEPAPDTAPDDRGGAEPAAEPDPAQRRSPWRMPLILGAAVVLGVVVVVLGIVNPRPPTGVATDRLGPAQGERIDDYLNESQDSLIGDDTDLHWALVSFTDYLTPQQIPAAAGGLRIAGVIQHVPIDRVQTPVITVATPAGDEPAVKSADAAAGLLTAAQYRDQRSADVARVTQTRLRAGCACTAGLVVRGTLPQLRELAAQPGVRAVQALPADAIAGRFAVAPLLPETTDVVAPTPDDAPVPAE